MTSNWPLKKISDVAYFRNSRRVPLNSLDRAKRQGKFPYYGASGVVDYIDDYIFDGSFLLISEDGENLRTRKTPIAFQAHGKFWVNNHAHILEEKEEGILDYLEYYFSILDLTPYITGAVQPKLNKANLDTIEIPIPPLDERRFLNRTLNHLRDKISVNNQTNQTLDQIAQALFKSWFVDFDPVKAKIEALASGGSNVDAELAAMSVIAAKDKNQLDELRQTNPDAFAKLAKTAALFPAAMQDSEHGEIPEGWTLSEIGKEVTVLGGGTPSTSNPDFWENGDINWTTPKDMSNLTSKVLVTTDRKITNAGLKKISSGLLAENTVLMSSRAPVGYLALAKIPVAINQGYIAMKCEQQLTPEYVMLWCEQNMEEIKQRASGTTFAEISKSSFKPIPVLVPTKEVIENFTIHVEDIYKIITSNVLQTVSLNNLKDTLLPKLLSGFIDCDLRGV